MADTLNRWWRVAATGFCFAVFGLGGVVVRCLVYPLLILFVKDAQKRVGISQAVIHHAFKCFVALMAGVGVLTYESRGLERLRRRGLLVLANHPTLIDVVFLIAFIRHADCIVKEALLQNPFTRGPILGAGFITNRGGEGFVADCARSLRSGNNLIIFPEGTRTPVHGPLRLQRGAAHVAVRGVFNITPIHIQSSLPFLSKGVPWWRVPVNTPHILIDVREDIETASLIDSTRGDAVAVRKVTDHLSEQFFGDSSRASY